MIYLFAVSLVLLIHARTSALSVKNWVGCKSISISFSTCRTCFASSSAAQSSALGIDNCPFRDVPLGRTLVLPQTKDTNTLFSVVRVLRYIT